MCSRGSSWIRASPWKIWPAVRETESRGGLDRNINREDCPFVVKTPLFCEQAREVLERPDIRVDIRGLYVAAESRRRMTREHVARMRVCDRVGGPAEPDSGRM